MHLIVNSKGNAVTLNASYHSVDGGPASAPFINMAYDHSILKCDLKALREKGNLTSGGIETFCTKLKDEDTVVVVQTK